MENRLMTIVFLDMQGYTKRSAKQTIDEMKLFHDQMFKFVADIVERWNGIMVKTMGDGFMVRFDSPTNAVQAGIEIQKKLEGRNAQMMNPESIVRFRVGINTGEVGIDEHGDLFGDPVNIAARIQTFADTNDVFIAEATYLAMNQNEFGAVDLGSQDLKNATREIRIYKVLKDGSPGSMSDAPANRVTKIGPDYKKFAPIAIALIVILVLGIAFFAGRRKGRNEHKKTNPAVLETKKLPDSEPDSAKPVGEKTQDDTQTTILDISADDPRLKFNREEAGAFADVLRHRKDKKYEKAEKICINMIKRQPGPKKIPWGLILTEMYFENGQKDKAEQMCHNLSNNAAIRPLVKKRIAKQLEKIRQKYPNK